MKESLEDYIMALKTSDKLTDSSKLIGGTSVDVF